MKKIFIYIIFIVSLIIGIEVKASVVSEKYQIVYTDIQSNFGYYIDNNKNLYSSGSNGQGQLGIGTITNETRINPIKIMENVELVTSGKSGFAIALTSSGELKAWGNNKYAQLGLNTGYNPDSEANCVVLPTTIEFPSNEDVLSIVAGAAHVLVLTESGNVYSFGSNLTGQLGLGLEANNKTVVGIPTKIDSKYYNNEKIIQISTTEYTSFLLSENGNVYGFGDNEEGLIVNNVNKLEYVTTPLKLELENIVKVSAKSTTAMALDKNNKVYAWGSNIFRQLGKEDFLEKNTIVLNDSNKIYTKVTIEKFYNLDGVEENIKPVDILCGGITNFVLSEDGDVYSFGSGGNGQVGFDIYDSKYSKNQFIVQSNVVVPTKIKFYEPINLEEKIASSDTSYNDLIPVNKNEIKVTIKSLISSIGVRTYVMDNEGNMWSFGDNSNGLANSGNVKNLTMPSRSTLFRVENYDKTVEQKNYLVKPIITLIIVFSFFIGFIIYTEVKNYRQAKKFKFLNQGGQNEKI